MEFNLEPCLTRDDPYSTEMREDVFSLDVSRLRMLFVFLSRLIAYLQ